MDAAEARLREEIEVAFARFRRRILLVVLATVAVDVVASVAAFYAERGAGDAFGTVWDAGFWVTTQLLTVSSSLPNPERAAAKLLDVGLEAWGVLVVAGLAGIVSDWLHHRTRHRAQLGRHPDLRG